MLLHRHVEIRRYMLLLYYPYYHTILTLYVITTYTIFIHTIIVLIGDDVEKRESGDRPDTQSSERYDTSYS